MATKLAVLKVPRLSPATRSKAKAAVKGAGKALARKAWDEKHTLTAVGSAAVLGYLERPGKDGKSTASSIPHLESLGLAGTLGGAAWVVSKLAKSTTAAHVATGLLSVQAYKFGRDESGDKKRHENASGDFDDVHDDE